jgi:hypothetical protein
MTRKLRVGKDLDGCYYNFAQAYYESCALLGISVPFRLPWDPPFEATRWEFYEDLGHSLPEFLDNCQEAADMGLLWAGPVWPGGKAAWNTLLSEGFELHVKTDRAFGSHPVASEVGTRMWLRREGMGYHSIRFGPDKTAGTEVDIMLEDKLENYDALEEAGTLVYLIDRPWNHAPGDARRRVYSHDEFVTRCKALARDLGIPDGRGKPRGLLVST